MLLNYISKKIPILSERIFDGDGFFIFTIIDRLEQKF